MGKGEDLPYQNAAFDVTCCINVIDHAQNPDEILAEVRRITKFGGLFVFGVNTLSWLGRLKWRMLRVFRPDTPLFVAHPHIYGWGQIHHKIRAGGWRIVWQDKPSLLQRLAGHGRMSSWILRKNSETCGCR